MNGCSSDDVGSGGDTSAVLPVPTKEVAKVAKVARATSACDASPPPIPGERGAETAPTESAAPSEVATSCDPAGADNADGDRPGEERPAGELLDFNHRGGKTPGALALSSRDSCDAADARDGEKRADEGPVGEVEVGEEPVEEVEVGEVQVREVQVEEEQVGEAQVEEVQVGEVQVEEEQVEEEQVGEEQVVEELVGEVQVEEEPVDEEQVEEEQAGEEQAGEEQAGEEQAGEEQQEEQKPPAPFPASDATPRLQGKTGNAKKEERAAKESQGRGGGGNGHLSKGAEAPVKDGQQLSAVEKKKAKGLGKEITLLMQALNALSTPEEKLAALCTKYTQLLEEHRATPRQIKGLEKKHIAAARERDHLQTEHGKALLARSKLESLCRELQRHNRTLKEENLQRAREEEEKRREVTAHFQATLTEIQAQMGQHNERNSRLKQENMELADKLKKLIEQYELREEHVNKVFRNKDLQQQLSDAKLHQTTELLELSGEQHLKEKELLIKQVTETQRRCEHMKQQEIQLKQQLALYTEKFEEFQGTLSKSNEVFNTFRQEMEKMTKKIKKQEKETSVWRTRWESSNKALLDMVEEKTQQDRDKEALNAKVQKLEKLCRALQNERNELRKLQGPAAGGEASSSAVAAAADTAPADDAATTTTTTSAAIAASSTETDVPSTPPTKPNNSNPEANGDPEGIPTVDGKADEPEGMAPVELAAPEPETCDAKPAGRDPDVADVPDCKASDPDLRTEPPTDGRDTAPDELPQPSCDLSTDQIIPRVEPVETAGLECQSEPGLALQPHSSPSEPESGRAETS